MKNQAIQLLNRILASSGPGEIICLPFFQAQQLAELSVHDLGRSLKDSIAYTSPAHALETQGLFSRRIKVVDNQPNFTVNC